MYTQYYPDRNYPNGEVFERLFRRFRESGSVVYSKQQRINEVTRNYEIEFAVLVSVADTPNVNSN